MSAPKNTYRFRMVLLVCLQCFLTLAWAQPLSTVFTGSVKNPIVEDLAIKFFEDNIAYEELTFDLKLDGSNHFATRLQLDDPLNISLIYRNITFPIFLFPGDSVNLYFDALNPAQNIKFTGKGALQNQWFFESSLAFREYEEEVINEQMIKLRPLDFYLYLDRVVKRKKSFFEQWMNGQPANSVVKHYIESDIDYWFVYQLFRYPSFHAAVNGISKPLAIPHQYFQALSKILVNNPDMQSDENYINFLEKLRQFWMDEPRYHSAISEAINEVYFDESSNLMLSDFKNGNVIGSFGKGAVFSTTGNKSAEQTDLLIGENYVSGHWIEVENGVGEKGWIHEYGLKKIPRPGAADDFYNLMAGKTLAFSLAKGIYWNDILNPAEYLDTAVEADLNGDYSKFIQPDVAPSQSITALNVMNEAETARIFGETYVDPNQARTKPIIRRAEAGEKPVAVNLPVLDPKPEFIPSETFRIFGTITGINERVIGLTWITDPVAQKDEKRIIRLEAGGKFELEVDLSEPIIGTLSIGRDAMDVIMRPGKSLEIKLNQPDLSFTNIYGVNGPAASFLLEKDTYLKSISPVYNRMIKELDGPGFTNYLAGHKQELIKRLGNTPQINFQDLTLLEGDINYWFGNELMNFPWEQPLRLGKDAPMVMSDEFYSFIDEITLTDESALANPSFINYLDQLLSHWENTTGFSRMELADQKLTGKIAWWVKASSLASPLRRGDVGRVVDEVMSFMDNCPEVLYRNEIRRLYNANKGLDIGDPAPDFQLTNVDGAPVQLESLKGKVIYLDFWATWCTPCLTQMRNSTQWKKQFEGLPVEFVYISLDRNKTDWNKFLSSQKVNGIHLHAGDNKVFLSLIAQLYKVKKLPAVFIINQEGIIEYSSGDPSILNASAEIIQSLL